MRTFASRALCTASMVGAIVMAGSGFASAHVSVSAPGATQGGYDVLTFRVPNESETAGTTKVTVQLPGLRSARTESLAGWQVTVTKDPATALATEVTWTADPGVQVGPGQFGEFRLSGGPLPETATVAFPTTQTFSDGSVVNWDQESADPANEPDHPAPTLALAPATGDAHGTATVVSGQGHATVAATTDTVTSDAAAAAGTAEPDSTARWLGGTGLVLGAAALALAIGNTVRGRRS